MIFFWQNTIFFSSWFGWIWKTVLYWSVKAIQKHIHIYIYNGCRAFGFSLSIEIKRCASVGIVFLWWIEGVRPPDSLSTTWFSDQLPFISTHWYKSFLTPPVKKIKKKTIPRSTAGLNSLLYNGTRTEALGHQYWVENIRLNKFQTYIHIFFFSLLLCWCCYGIQIHILQRRFFIVFFFSWNF